MTLFFSKKNDMQIHCNGNVPDNFNLPVTHKIWNEIFNNVEFTDDLELDSSSFGYLSVRSVAFSLLVKLPVL